jgi:hypothetical protein
MASLAVRSSGYFFRRAIKFLGIILGVAAFIVGEMFVLNFGEESMIESILLWAVVGPAMMASILNMTYSLYSVSWQDSMVLAMGARRRDIFWGEIIQTAVLLGGSLLVDVILVLATNQQYMFPIIGLMYSLALPTGAIAMVVAHKLQKYGRVVMMIFVVIAAVIGGMIGGTAATGNVFFFNWFAATPVVAVAAVSVVVYLLLEVWVYQLNKTSMVH